MLVAVLFAAMLIRLTPSELRFQWPMLTVEGLSKQQMILFNQSIWHHFIKLSLSINQWVNVNEHVSAASLGSLKSNFSRDTLNSHRSKSICNSSRRSLTCRIDDRSGGDFVGVRCSTKVDVSSDSWKMHELRRKTNKKKAKMLFASAERETKSCSRYACGSESWESNQTRSMNAFLFALTCKFSVFFLVWK